MRLHFTLLKWYTMASPVCPHSSSSKSPLIFLIDIVPVDFAAKDAFTVIRGGEKALMERLEEYPEIKNTVIRRIREYRVPTIYKERNPSGFIFNTILLAHLPKLIPPELIQKALNLFWIMMTYRKLWKSHSHSESRSDLEFLAYHLGIWRKKGMLEPNLTSETRAGSAEAREATFAFLQAIGEIAKIILPFMEALCPRLMFLLHRYVCIDFTYFQPSSFCRIGDRIRALHPNLPFSFHDVFFSVAIRIGSSEKYHTDWSDCRRGGMAFVLTLSEWSGGGDLVLPQLKRSVRPVPGDVTCVQAARLLHQTTTPGKGQRVVLTFFTDNALFPWAFGEEWYTELRNIFAEASV
jgi:hypothetical protein